MSSKEWWPCLDWPNEEILGYPSEPNKDSFGHILRVDGVVDIYCWRAEKQWFETEKGRWVSPIDLVNDGDSYIGQLKGPFDDV